MSLVIWNLFHAFYSRNLMTDLRHVESLDGCMVIKKLSILLLFNMPNVWKCYWLCMMTQPAFSLLFAEQRFGISMAFSLSFIHIHICMYECGHLLPLSPAQLNPAFPANFLCKTRFLLVTWGILHVLLPFLCAGFQMLKHAEDEFGGVI